MRVARPTKATAGGSAYLALRARAQLEHRPTDELILLYVLEGFLARLAASSQASKLVLKGGVLLAAYDVRRPTRDVDLQGRRLANDREAMLVLVKDVAAIDLPDGLAFSTDAASAETIRDEDEYSGVRVTLRCALETASVVFHVDVSVGDPVWPAPRSIALPRLLGGEIVLPGYPLPMVLAEKIVTAVQRGTANTRWRDFADVLLLSARHPIVGDDLWHAVQEVGRFRRVELVPLVEVLEGFADIAQPRWGIWRRKQKLEDRLPAGFAEVLEAASRISDPVIAGHVLGKTWNPGTHEWA